MDGASSRILSSLHSIYVRGVNSSDQEQGSMVGHFPEKAVHGGKVRELRRIFGHDFLDVSASMNPFVPQVGADFSCADFSITDVLSEDLFVMRSLTKSFAVPGIRFGSPDLIKRIETARTLWTINAFAEYYAKLAFAQYHQLRDAAERIAAEREWYYARLDDLGLSYERSSVNYILIHLNRSVVAFTRAMIDQGVLVRDCTSFGLPECIRVSVETREKNVRVLEAIAACLR